MKRMSRFHPSERCDLAEAERHYLQVHHRFARELFRYHAPTVTRYATARAVAQYDMNGRFEKRPDVWRFILLEFEDTRDAEGAPTTGKEWLPSWAESAIVDDHTNFLREVRPFVVEESVLVDRRGPQLTSVKYVFEFEHATVTDGTDDASLREPLRRALVDAAQNAFGLRLLVENKVLTEAEMAPAVEPGQAYTGRLLENSTMAYIDEYHFDHRAWAEEFFASDTVREALRSSGFARVGGYRVEELVGVDRR